MLEGEEKARKRGNGLDFDELSNIILVEIGHFWCFDLRPELKKKETWDWKKKKTEEKEKELEKTLILPKKKNKTWKKRRKKKKKGGGVQSSGSSSSSRKRRTRSTTTTLTTYSDSEWTAAEDTKLAAPALALPGVGRHKQKQLYSTRRVFLMRSDEDWNELPSETNLAHREEQQNLVSPLKSRLKTDASAHTVRWA